MSIHTKPGPVNPVNTLFLERKVSHSYPIVEHRPSRFRSNGSPPDFSDFLPNLRQDFKSYDAQIMNLRRVMTKLRRGRANLSSLCDQYCGFVGPITRIPMEIWTEIFLLACCEQSMSPFSPQDLSLVCRHWARIIGSTPKLWRFLAYEQWVDASSRQKILQQPEESHSQRLTIILRLSTYDFTQKPEDAVRVLSQESRRWEHLALQLETPSACLDAFCHLTNKLDSLETLELGTSWGMEQLQVAPSDLAVFATAPNLKYLILESDSFTLPADVSWSHILAIQLYSMSVQHMLDMVQLCSGGAMILPALTSLIIEAPCGLSEEFPVIAFRSLIQASHCRLRSLSFSGFRVSYEALVDQMLDCTPNLIELVLGYHRGKPLLTGASMRQLMKKFAFPENNPLEFLPCLKHLDLALYGDELDVVLNMLEYRNHWRTLHQNTAPTVSLETIVLRVTYNRSPVSDTVGSTITATSLPFRIRTQALRNAGLKVYTYIA